MSTPALNWTRLLVVLGLLFVVVSCSSGKSKVDDSPDTFTLSSSASSTAVDFGEEYEASATINGINRPVPISITGGMYKIGADGTYTSSPGTVASGDTVYVKLTASTFALDKATATLTVNKTSASFSVTTKADDVPPEVTIGTPPTTEDITGNSAILSGIANDPQSGLASVTATVNNGEAIEAGYGEAGSWFLDLPVIIGENTVVVTVTDNNGVQTVSEPIVITKADDAPPALSITSHQNNGAVTGAAISVSGTAIDEHNSVASVSVKINDSAATTATLDAETGAWSAADLPINIGANTLSVFASDSLGNTTPIQTLTLNKADDVIPTVAFTAPTDAATVAGQSVTVTGTSSDEHSAIASVTIKINTGDETSATLTAATGAWTASLPLTIGTNTVTVYSTDAAGNKSESKILTLNKLDDIAPTLAITAPANAATVSGESTTVTGTVSDAHSGVQSVSVSNNEGAAIAATITEGAWSATVPIIIGTNAISVTASDVQGLQTTQSVTVSKDDDVPPSVAFSTPAADAIVTGQSVTVTGTSADVHSTVASVTIKINTGEETPATLTAATGAWTASLPLTIGTNTITVYSTDALGNNSASEVLSVTKEDDVAPTVAITTPTAGATVTGDTTAVSGTASDVHSAVASVTLTVNASNVATTLNTDGTWSATAPIQIGANTITASSTDAKGNVSESVSITVNKEDDVPPTAEIKFPPPVSMTEGATVFVRGEADDEHSDIASVTVNGQEAAVVAVVDGPDTWSLDGVALAEGDNTIAVVVTDAKSNTKEDTVSILRTNDLNQAFPNDDVPFEYPQFIVVDANNDDNFAYVTDRVLNSVVQVSLETGSRVVLADNNTKREADFNVPRGIAFDGVNTLYIGDRDSFHAVDIATGERVTIASASDSNSLMSIPIGMKIDSGLLYVADSKQIYSVSLSGEQTVVTSSEVNFPEGEDTPIVDILYDLSFNRELNQIYAIDTLGANVLQVDPVTGVRDILFNFNVASFGGIAFDAQQSKVYVTNQQEQQVVVGDVSFPNEAPIVFDGTNPNSTNLFIDPWTLVVNEKLGYAIVIDRGLLGLTAMDLETGSRVIISKSDTTPE